MAWVVDGKLPTFANTFACCSGAVSQAISFAASSLCGLDAGMPRYDPPQLPPAPPGRDVTFHLPAPASPALPLM